MEDDPEAMAHWFDSRGMQEMGIAENAWSRFLYVCSQGIRTALRDKDRKTFRALMLRALDAGRSAGALSFDRYTEQSIYARITYIRNSEESPEWRAQEMAYVLQLFLEWAHTDVENVRIRAASWREASKEEILALRRMKTYLELIDGGAEYFDSESYAIFNDWRSLIPILP
ncbi:MAG TPA: hypothetical protein VGG16_20345 [Streptosporangiaceae bacterium]|jgi:hypothetical protein